MQPEEMLYHKLRAHIDMMPIAFPETSSGVEIRLLKQLFTPKEAEIALELSAVPEPLGRIHKRLKKRGLSRKKLEETLDSMVQKGNIMGGAMFEKLGKGKCYSKSLMAIGMFEAQVDRITEELSRDFEEYVHKEFHGAFYGKKTGQMRTIPVNSTVVSDHYIDTYDNIREYMKGLEGDISVMNCICRQAKDVTGGSCSQSSTRETCLGFHEVAKLVIDRGQGRPISLDEAIEIVNRAEENGFVLQPENNKNPRYLCCCCADCCHVLKGLKRFPRPAEHFQSSYRSHVTEAACTGCGKCIKACPMGALNLKDKKAVVDYDRCIGCGVCAVKCDIEAISLHKKESPHVPPKNNDIQYQKIMMERFGLAGTLKIAGKAVLGMKI